MISLIIKKEESGQTLEKYVKKVLNNAPMSFIYKLFRKKDVKINGHWQDKKYVVSEGEEVKIFVTDSQLEEFKSLKDIKSSLDISNWIIYEDHNILLINKPRGVLVQKDNSGDEALDDMVLAYLSNKGEYDLNSISAYKPAPAHRLDRNTAGIVVFGKNISSLRELADVMNDKNKVSKRYLAIVKGEIDQGGEINAPLEKNAKNGRVYINENGKPSITRYKVKEKLNGYTLLEVELLTGRTHQIRAHMAYINHPVIGDSKYGDFSLNKEIENKYGFKNQFLIAYQLYFHSLDNNLKYLSGKKFEIPLPKEFIDLINKLNKEKL